MNISIMRLLTWLVSKPVIDKTYLQTCSKYALSNYRLYFIRKILKITFCCIKDEELSDAVFLQTGQLEKNVAQKCLWSELVQCSIFCQEEIDDLIMARTRATRGKNETKKYLNKSKFYSIFNINIQFSKTIGAAN